MLRYIVVIVVGAVAWRGASTVVYDLGRNPGNVPLAFLDPEGFWQRAVRIYILAAPLAAALNGYALGGWSGLVIVLVGTWGGMLLTNIFLRFNPAVQFFAFGFINALFTFLSLDRLLG